MRPARKFKRRLDHLVRGIAPSGREHTRELIRSVIDAGGVSESALLEMVRDGNLGTPLRCDICWLLPRLPVESAGAALEALLSDPSERIREEAAAGLGLVSREDAVDALHEALEHDSSTAVRLAATRALSVQSSPRSAALLVRILQDSREPDELRADAAEALAHVKEARVVDALIDALAASSPSIRYSAAYALGEQGDHRALPALREVASGDDETTPWGSLTACARESIEKLMNQ